MAVSKHTVAAFKSCQNQAQVLVRNYLLADTFIPYKSVLGGIFACKVVYDLSQLVSTFYFRSYNALSNVQKIEWNNRSMSTLHAILITFISTYFVFWSDLFSDNMHFGLITFRSSPVSIVSLGVSVGYFLVDLGMIFWLVLLFLYMFYHVYMHYNQVSEMHAFGRFLVCVVPVALAAMNLIWFVKILKGLKKTLTKWQ